MQLTDRQRHLLRRTFMGLPANLRFYGEPVDCFAGRGTLLLGY